MRTLQKRFQLSLTPTSKFRGYAHVFTYILYLKTRFRAIVDFLRSLFVNVDQLHLRCFPVISVSILSTSGRILHKFSNIPR